MIWNKDGVSCFIHPYSIGERGVFYINKTFDRWARPGRCSRLPAITFDNELHFGTLPVNFQSVNLVPAYHRRERCFKQVQSVTECNGNLYEKRIACLFGNIEERLAFVLDRSIGVLFYEIKPGSRCGGRYIFSGHDIAFIAQIMNDDFLYLYALFERFDIDSCHASCHRHDGRGRFFDVGLACHQQTVAGHLFDAAFHGEKLVEGRISGCECSGTL